MTNKESNNLPPELTTEDKQAILDALVAITYSEEFKEKNPEAYPKTIEEFEEAPWYWVGEFVQTDIMRSKMASDAIKQANEKFKKQEEIMKQVTDELECLKNGNRKTKRGILYK